MYKILVNLLFLFSFIWVFFRISRKSLRPEGRISPEIITLSFIITLYALQGMPAGFSDYAGRFPPDAGMIIRLRFIFSLLLRAGLILTAAGIILRKEVFRKGIIFLSVIIAATIFWKHPQAPVKRYLIYKIQEGLLPQGWLPRIDGIVFLYIVIYSVLDLAFVICLICIFKHDQIKKQFR